MHQLQMVISLPYESHCVGKLFLISWYFKIIEHDGYLAFKLENILISRNDNRHEHTRARGTFLSYILK